jgi:transcriptional regulator with XRE-family HTH domain
LPAYQRERRQLADALRSLRVAAGLSGAELGARLGWPQSKISKIETLKQLPEDAEVTAWTQATGASTKDKTRLLEMLRGARVEYAGWKDAYRAAGPAGVQADILEIESRSAIIGEWQPSWIPGLLHTAAYARETLRLPCGPASFGADQAQVEQMINVRMQRHQALYDTGKKVHMVLTEGALRYRSVPVPVLADQLDRLIDISGLSALELCIIPSGALVPVYGLGGFRLYDDIVIIESIVGEQQLSEAEDVARYGRYLELLREAAVTGPEAVAIIRRAQADIRAGTS